MLYLVKGLKLLWKGKLAVMRKSLIEAGELMDRVVSMTVK